MKTSATTLSLNLSGNPGTDWRRANDPSVPTHSKELLEVRHWDWGKTK